MKAKNLARGAIIAAMYTVLTYLQNFLLPDSASAAIQFRASEALCVLALFTPDAFWGLSLGCLLFNISYAGAMPMDWLIGTAATALATLMMYRLRRIRVFRVPLPALLMPAAFNAVFVGSELSVYFQGTSLPLNMLYVAIGELAVLLTLGIALYFCLTARGLNRRLFPEEQA